MPSKSPSHRIKRNSTRSSPCSQPDSPCHARESARFVVPRHRARQEPRGLHRPDEDPRQHQRLDGCLGRRAPGPPGHESHPGHRNHQHPHPSAARTDPDRTVHSPAGAAVGRGNPRLPRDSSQVRQRALRRAATRRRRRTPTRASSPQCLTLPIRIETAKRYVRHDQVNALAVGSRPHGRELGYGTILLMPYCGLRWGELSGLRLRDLDLPAPVSRRSRPSSPTRVSSASRCRGITSTVQSRSRSSSSPRSSSRLPVGRDYSRSISGCAPRPTRATMPFAGAGSTPLLPRSDSTGSRPTKSFW